MLVCFVRLAGFMSGAIVCLPSEKGRDWNFRGIRLTYEGTYPGDLEQRAQQTHETKNRLRYRSASGFQKSNFVDSQHWHPLWSRQQNYPQGSHPCGVCVPIPPTESASLNLFYIFVPIVLVGGLFRVKLTPNVQNAILIIGLRPVVVQFTLKLPPLPIPPFTLWAL